MIQTCTKNMSDVVPSRDAYPECSEEQLIGKALPEARYREGLTQIKVVELTGIPQRHISEMEHGKRTIGKKNAKLFADVLNTDYRVIGESAARQHLIPEEESTPFRSMPAGESGARKQVLGIYRNNLLS